MLAGPADHTRPANPWPRLLLFGAFVLGVIFLAGLCVASFASTPEREIRVRLSELEPGTPKFLAVTSFGHDQFQRTFGAYLAVPEDLGAALGVPGDMAGPVALFSRDPDSGCNLRWDPVVRGVERRGQYVDPCSDARFAFDGRALHEGATRDLHRFAVRRDGSGYVVSFETLTLGECHGTQATGCSPAGEVLTRDVPRGALPADFGTR